MVGQAKEMMRTEGRLVERWLSLAQAWALSLLTLAGTPYSCLGLYPDSGLCPSNATFLTLGHPGFGARASQPCLLPGWIRQSPRTCRAGRLTGGAGAGPGAALCQRRTRLQQGLVWLWQEGSAGGTHWLGWHSQLGCLGPKPR